MAKLTLLQWVVIIILFFAATIVIFLQSKVKTTAQGLRLPKLDNFPQAKVPPVSQIKTKLSADSSLDTWLHNVVIKSKGSTVETVQATNSGINPISPPTASMKHSSPATSPPRNRLHAVTYASHGGRDDRFCRAVESAVRNDFDLIVLGWGVPWRGLSQKLEAAHSYAKSLPPRDVILFTDAFDVLFQGKSEQILSIFLAQNASVVFSAECGCWPHVMENHGRDCFEKYPQSPTPYRYLNSGTWIGYASAAAEMLAVVMNEAGSDFANANDQKLMADLYISGRFDIKLDFFNTIFQSMHMTLSPPLARCNPTEDVRFDSTSKTYVNQRTGGKPAVLHFNGGGKAHHLQMESKAWYKASRENTPDKKENVRNTRLQAPTKEKTDRRLAFRDLCPSYLL